MSCITSWVQNSTQQRLRQTEGEHPWARWEGGRPCDQLPNQGLEKLYFMSLYCFLSPLLLLLLAILHERAHQWQLMFQVGV